MCLVVKTSWARSGRVKRCGKEQMVIGEYDLLPTLISEFPGLELSSAALNNAWKKQFRQIEALTKHESNHALKKRLSEKRVCFHFSLVFFFFHLESNE